MRAVAICRFAEPISLTSLFPYLPEMIASFRIPEDDIGYWAGLTSACYSLTQCISAIPWGRASDRFGRKPIILLCLFNTMVTTLLWGFSTSLPMAMTARLLSGAGNGNVGIIRTMVAEMCPWRELQPRAFSIMPLVYNVGSVLGPSLGGALANPYGLRPGEHRSNALLDRFPYVAPNLVAAAFFMVGLITGVFFLKETLDIKKGQRDWGLVIGHTVTSSTQEAWRRIRSRLSRQHITEETDPLLKHTNGATVPELEHNDDEEEARPAKIVRVAQKPPTFAEVLNKQSVLNLVAYTMLALHSIGFDQLIPVFLHHHRQDLSSPSVELPFKFKSGFGATSGEIGAMFTLYGIMNIVFQLLIFPPTAQRVGVLRCMKVVAVTYVAVYILIPFAVLVPGWWGVGTLFALWTVKGLAGSFAFPCSTILLTNSASSLRILGTLNGIATSVSAIGRALGPTIGGNAFTYGVKQIGYVIFPFWILSAIAAVAAIPVFFLVEGKGFGGDDDPTPEDADDEESDDERASPVFAESLTVEPAPVAADGVAPPAQRVEDDVSRSESEYGSIAGLSRTNSRRPTQDRSMSFTSSVLIEDEDEAFTSSSAPDQGMRRTGSKVLRRQSSIPLGAGQGFRRLSSNLGQNMSGYGTGNHL